MINSTVSVWAAPQVVVSIKPIHSLVAAVMDKVAEPVLLLDGTADPHNYSLRPSQARAVENADVMVWIGSGFEYFLTGSVDNLSAETHVITLIDTPGLLIPRGSRRFDKDTESHHADDANSGAPKQDDHTHTHSNHDPHEGHTDSHTLDPHIWLSPANAVVIARAVSDRLARVDPDNAAQYQRNSEALTNRIAALDDRLSGRLTRVKDMRYLVAHDAYQAFEQHFGLLPGGILRINTAVSPGIRHLRAVRRTVLERNIECILTEPGFPDRFIAVVTEGTTLAVSEVDVLGSAFPAGPTQWFDTLNAVADSFLRCVPNDPA